MTVQILTGDALTVLRTLPAESVHCVVTSPPYWGLRAYKGGAGTVGLVADRLQRDAILIEISPEYAEMARRRIADDAPMFAEVMTC